MAVYLVRPGSLATEIVESTSDANDYISLGREGTDDFVIKTIDAKFVFQVPTIETTGDGDTTPVFETSGLLYGNFRLLGGMVKLAALGLQDLWQQCFASSGLSGNPRNVFRFAFNLDDDTTLGWTGSAVSELNCIIERVSFDWASKGVIIPLAVAGRFSEATRANIEVSNIT